MGEEPRIELCHLTVSNLNYLYYTLFLAQLSPVLQLFLRETFAGSGRTHRSARLRSGANPNGSCRSTLGQSGSDRSTLSRSARPACPP